MPRYLTITPSGGLRLVEASEGGSGGLNYYSIDTTGVSIARGQIMQTSQLEISGTGSIDVNGAVEIR